MLKRKIEAKLVEWKTSSNKKPLIIKGPRQCGKTFSVIEFAKKNYNHFVYLNFVEDKNYKNIFSGSLNVDYLCMMIGTLLGPSAVFEEGNTLIILDEIQECPEARTALKFFKLDGRFDVIGTGALLGVNGYGEESTSIPVGYETTIDMYPLDFEEFLWANGINDEVFSFLKNCLENETPVPDALHNKMHQLLLQYSVVGGMPSVVESFINTHNINSVTKEQTDIVNSYKDDMIKHATGSMKGRIRECFESIPNQLSKENKKFQFSIIKKSSTASQYLSSIQWIEDAGIISRCYNLNITEFPLSGNAINDIFKVYMNDSGLFVSMLDSSTSFDILSGNLWSYKGAIFENLIAGILSKNGRKLYYFHKESGLEIDFVIMYKGEVTLVEVKAQSGNTKSAKTVLSNFDNYHVKFAIKIGNYNVGREGNILTLPHYMAFLL